MKVGQDFSVTKDGRPTEGVLRLDAESSSQSSENWFQVRKPET